MKHVDIYLENAGKSVKKKEGWYGYVLAYQGTQLYTREGFRKTEDTRNERDVRMLLEALSRCKPCEAVIHTESQYLQGTFGRLAHYRENGWKKSDTRLSTGRKSNIALKNWVVQRKTYTRRSTGKKLAMTGKNAGMRKRVDRIAWTRIWHRLRSSRQT